jgi:hypothetical protein
VRRGVHGTGTTEECFESAAAWLCCRGGVFVARSGSPYGGLISIRQCLLFSHCRGDDAKTMRRYAGPGSRQIPCSYVLVIYCSHVGLFSSHVVQKIETFVVLLPNTVTVEEACLSLPAGCGAQIELSSPGQQGSIVASAGSVVVMSNAVIVVVDELMHLGCGPGSMWPCFSHSVQWHGLTRCACMWGDFSLVVLMQPLGEDATDCQGQSARVCARWSLYLSEMFEQSATTGRFVRPRLQGGCRASCSLTRLNWRLLALGVA